MKLTNLVNVERVQYGNKLKLYFREGKTKRVQIIDDFYPYFYIDNNYLASHPKIVHTLKELYRRRKLKEAKHTNIFSLDNCPTSKIVYYDPYQTYELRELFFDPEQKYRCFEADIEYQRRWMIDTVDELEKANYRKLHIDIETTTTFGFPDWEHPEKEKVTCVSLADSYTKQVVTFILAPDGMQLDGAYKKLNITDEELGQGPLFIFKYEHQMLSAILQSIKKLDPDLICGWNVYFDVLYLLERANKLGVHWFAKEFHYRAKKKEAKYSPKGKNIQPVELKIDRFIIFDLLGPYKQLEFRELPSYSLDWVIKEELGIEKGKLRITDFTRFWKEQFEQFWKYNRQDAKYCMMVDDKAEIVDYFEDLRVFAKLPRIDMTNVWSKLTDNIILNMYKDKIALPTKFYPENFYENKEKISGGYVKDLLPEYVGTILKNIYVLDFKSMYPNIILALNLSKETLNHEGKGIHFVIPEDNVDCWIDQEKEGIIPTVVAYMQDLKNGLTIKRDQFVKDTDEWKFWEKRRYSVKTVNNSVYGVTTYAGFRLFQREIGSITTFVGRSLIQYIHRRLERDGIRVIYSDTDSSFVQLPSNIDVTVVMENINGVYTADYMDETFPGHRKLTLFVEMEKMYPQLYFIAKKTYIGQKKSGELQYVGGDLKKSKTPPIFRTILEKVVQTLFDGKDTKSIILEGIKQIQEEQDIEKFRIPMKLERKVIWDAEELRNYRTLLDIRKLQQLKAKKRKTEQEKKTIERLEKKVKPREFTPIERKLIEENPYSTNIPVVQAVKKCKDLWNIEFKEGQKFYGLQLLDGIIAFDRIDNKQEQYLLDNLDRANYLENFAQKLSLMHLADKEYVLQLIEKMHFEEAPTQTLNQFY